MDSYRQIRYEASPHRMRRLLQWRQSLRRQRKGNGPRLCTILGRDTKPLETYIINEDDPGSFPPVAILAPQE